MSSKSRTMRRAMIRSGSFTPTETMVTQYEGEDRGLAGSVLLLSIALGTVLTVLAVY